MKKKEIKPQEEDKWLGNTTERRVLTGALIIVMALVSIFTLTQYLS